MNAAFLMPRRGLCLILSSPSGAGKTTLARGLLASDTGLKSSGPGKKAATGGGSGRACTISSFPLGFEALRDGRELLEFAEVFGNFYGTPAQPVREALAQGNDIVFDVDGQGAASIASILPEDTVRVFILPPSAR